MKNRKMIAAVILLALLILVACTAKATQAPTSAPGGAAATATTALTCSTPSVDVDALIREKLQNHHSIDRIYSAHHTREEWNATLDRMIGYGANISESVKQTIIDYLLCKQQ